MAGTDHLYEFARWLSTKGCGTIGRTLFVNAEPDDTTAASVFVFEERGPAPYITYSTGSFVRRPRFRIDVRSTAPASTQGEYPDVTNARNLAQNAYDACRQLAGVTLHSSTGPGHSSGNWLSAAPECEPYLAGRDSVNRVVFSFLVQGDRQG